MSNLTRLFLFQLFLLLLFFIILKVQNTISFGKPGPGAVDLQIIIVKGDVRDSSLILNPSDGYAYQKMKVKWVIAAGSNVKSFFISRKKGSPQIFKFYDLPLWLLYQHEGDATVKKDVADGTEYVYSIHWKDTTGKKYVFDPKISVKPNPLLDLDFLFYILYFASVIISFIFRKKFLYK